jgi:hypothetical protein
VKRSETSWQRRSGDQPESVKVSDTHRIMGTCLPELITAAVVGTPLSLMHLKYCAPAFASSIGVTLSSITEGTIDKKMKSFMIGLLKIEWILKSINLASS